MRSLTTEIRNAIDGAGSDAISVGSPKGTTWLPERHPNLELTCPPVVARPAGESLEVPMPKIVSVHEAAGDALVRARQLSKELNAAADALNRTIEAAEKDLAKLRLGVSASIELNPDEQCDVEEWLAFRKYGVGWRLVIERGPSAGEPLDCEVLPLVTASRDTRKTAISKLPELFRALVDAAERELAAISEVNAAGEAFRATLSGSGPGSDPTGTAKRAADGRKGA